MKSSSIYNSLELHFVMALNTLRMINDSICCFTIEHMCEGNFVLFSIAMCLIFKFVPGLRQQLICEVVNVIRCIIGHMMERKLTNMRCAIFVLFGMAGVLFDMKKMNQLQVIWSDTNKGSSLKEFVSFDRHILELYKKVYEKKCEFGRGGKISAPNRFENVVRLVKGTYKVRNMAKKVQSRRLNLDKEQIAKNELNRQEKYEWTVYPLRCAIPYPTTVVTMFGFYLADGHPWSH